MKQPTKQELRDIARIYEEASDKFRELYIKEAAYADRVTIAAYTLLAMLVVIVVWEVIW